MKSLLYKSFSTASALSQSKSQTVLCFQSGMRIQNPHLNITNFQDNAWKQWHFSVRLTATSTEYKTKKSKENFLIVFLSRLGNLTSWFPLDHVCPYYFWKYSLTNGISTLKYDIQCFYPIHNGNHLRETGERGHNKTPTPSMQLFLHLPTQCTWTPFNFFYTVYFYIFWGDSKRNVILVFYIMNKALI